MGQIWDSAPYDALLDRLALGQQWAFRLTANPVTRGTASKREGTRGKVLPHVTPAQQTDWLLSKAAR
ncbi:type I-E CRISPR-associated protein Cas6/Cse3/CasE, partial [Streptococcus pneumoniae]|uniref:type I-E CRISPR-associated protein Cas6/Cse3/CasE n=1 Tax=Streptococcus pneumoniae TaxID=1313 RepID=UPI00307D1131